MNVLGVLRRCACGLTLGMLSAYGGYAQDAPAFQQALVAAVASDRDVLQFYHGRDYAPLWMRGDGIGHARLDALMNVLSGADTHGLPAALYDVDTVRAAVQSAQSPTAKGALEGQLSKLFLEYARDVQTGIIVPSRVDKRIVRKVPYRSRGATLAAFAQASPRDFMQTLPPQTPRYAALRAHKMRLETMVATGGWGPVVSARSLRVGATGPMIAELRDRLHAMGYLDPTDTMTYDDDITEGVTRFQQAHGLATDGIAGRQTLRELNVTMAARLSAVIVAMERERWINQPLGDRHIWVNIADFSAKVIDNGAVTFETRTVVGAKHWHKRTPEFSDTMEYMVINPSWFVPRSIATREFLPLLQANSDAVSYLEMRDSQGTPINRAEVNFASYDAQTFPYSFRQPPSERNALGLVKFMFPNKYNIYLHDTPHKHLFARETRAFSHGCIRLNDPFDLAYTLLAPQTDDPAGFFHAYLRTGREARVNLETPVPVHLVYRTALVSAEGHLEFRRDLYGRDAKIWAALRTAGVVLPDVSG